MVLKTVLTMSRNLLNDSNAMGGTTAFRPCTRSFSLIFVVTWADGLGWMRGFAPQESARIPNPCLGCLSSAPTAHPHPSLGQRPRNHRPKTHEG